MATSTANPYDAALQQLSSLLSVAPSPAEYKYRIVVLMSLCVLQFVTSVTYLFLNISDLRRRGKRLRLIWLQPLREGRLVTFNMLCLYTLFNALSAIVLGIETYRNYTVYIQGRKPRDEIILFVMSWIGPMLSGLFFSFGNISALIAITRKGGFHTATRSWIWMHNFTLPVLLLLWFGYTIPLGLWANRLYNKLPEQTIALFGMLTQASNAFNTLSNPNAGGFAILSDLTPIIASARLQLLRDKTTAIALVKALIAMASAYSFAFGLAALASFSFARQLQKQSRWNRMRKSAEEHTDPSAPSSVKISAKSQDKVIETGEAAALTRLAADLTLSLPITLAVGLVIPICGIYWLSRIEDTDSWSMLELRLDATAWVEVIANSCIMIFFLVSHVTQRGKYGQSSALDKVSSSVSKYDNSRSLSTRGIQVTMLDRSANGGTYVLQDPVQIPLELSVKRFKSHDNGFSSLAGEQVQNEGRLDEKW